MYRALQNDWCANLLLVAVFYAAAKAVGAPDLRHEFYERANEFWPLCYFLARATDFVTWPTAN